MGFAPGAQVERVINYAVSQGIKRFAALVPDNTYGQLVGQTFQLAVARSGGVVVVVQNYNPAQHGAGKSDSHSAPAAASRIRSKLYSCPRAMAIWKRLPDN